MNGPCEGGPDIHFWYGDANNLYGTVMEEYLPLCDFRWLFNPELEDDEEYMTSDKGDFWDWYETPKAEEYIMSIPADAPRGFILDVDIDFPKEVHDKLNDYPPCPESKLCDAVSDFTKCQFEEEGNRWLPPKTTKLVSDLTQRRKYVIHYRNLQQAIQLGAKLMQINRVFDFQQERWLYDYIQYNTERRGECSKAGDISGKELFKLMSNSIYGKMVEDVMRRREVRVFFGDRFDKGVKRARDYASEHRMKRWKIIYSSMEEEEGGMLVMEIVREKVIVDRPVVVGFTVLELSKWWMFDFYYAAAKKHWGDRIRLMYTDTDSLVCRIESTDIEREMKEFNDTYDRLHPSKLGYFKDEHGGLSVKGFIALRPKMYAFGYYDHYCPEVKDFVPMDACANHKHKQDAHFMKHKGFPKKSVDVNTGEHTTYEKYWDVYDGIKGSRVEFQSIRPQTHVKATRPWELRTQPMVKRGLAYTDDKSFWFNKDQCVRFGHWRIEEMLPLPAWPDRVAMNPLLQDTMVC
jgi:hypothetical protein